MNLDYIAGFLDADGSITFGTYDDHDRVGVSIYNEYRNVLQQFRDFLKVGHVYEDRSTTKRGYKQAWVFRMSAFYEVKNFLEILHSYLIVKKKKAIDCLQFIKDSSHRRTWREFDSNEVFKKYNELSSLRETAKHFKTNRGTINRILKNACMV